MLIVLINLIAKALPAEGLSRQLNSIYTSVKSKLENNVNESGGNLESIIGRRKI
jgi:hypothetical protein